MFAVAEFLEEERGKEGRKDKKKKTRQSEVFPSFFPSKISRVPQKEKKRERERVGGIVRGVRVQGAPSIRRVSGVSREVCAKKHDVPEESTTTGAKLRLRGRHELVRRFVVRHFFLYNSLEIFLFAPFFFSSGRGREFTSCVVCCLRLTLQ